MFTVVQNETGEVLQTVTVGANGTLPQGGLTDPVAVPKTSSMTTAVSLGLRWDTLMAWS